MEKKTRVTFYVDGFNFYFGLRRTRKADNAWSNTYWINLVKLFDSFLGPDQQLEKVVYFTASPLSFLKITLTASASLTIFVVRTGSS